MKYVLLIYSSPQTWEHPTFLQAAEALAMSVDDRNAMIRERDALIKEIDESGELIAAEPLAHPMNTRTIRMWDGVPTATDGPYIEVKEQLAGYFVVDCGSIERATEIAMRFPDSRFGAVEVRPIMDMSGQEM